MSGAAARRDEWARRVRALGPAGREALARALGIPSVGVQGDGPPAREELIACLLPTGTRPSADELAAFLRERLPEYMVPSRFVSFERLPRNAAGKLDRDAVDPEAGEELGAGSVSDVVAPRDAVEERLVEIWKDVLDLDVVSVHDDFFEIGGDSLLSIRAISRAARAGIPIQPDDFFEDPTIAGLAAAAREALPETPRGPVTGEAPLTPIQAWFFDRIDEDRHHWNQALLLGASRPVDPGVVEEAVTALVAHHDALRLRFRRGPHGWVQWFAPVSADPAPYRTVDLSGLPEAERAARMEEEADREHASLDLEEGRLFRVVCFGDDRGVRVLLLAHHLVVDAVSWGLLVEDLSTLVQQRLAGRPLRLPGRTCSASRWAEGLRERATASEVVATLDRWLTDRSPAHVSVPRDGESGEPDRFADARVHTEVLDEPETARLLSAGGAMQERVLTALLLAWSEWSGRRTLQLDLEGHGREVLGGRFDTSRTVGWFTSVFPLTVALRDTPGFAPALAHVRDALQALPLGGGTHGLLRFLHPDATVREALAAAPRSEVLFNYLGTTDSLVPADSPFRLLPGPLGEGRSPSVPRAYVIEVNARISAGRLTVDVEYSTKRHRTASIERLAGDLRRILLESTARRSPDESRFGLAGLDRAGLDQVADLLSEIDEG